jgi:hypothetical protein
VIGTVSDIANDAITTSAARMRVPSAVVRGSRQHAILMRAQVVQMVFNGASVVGEVWGSLRL